MNQQKESAGSKPDAKKASTDIISNVENHVKRKDAYSLTWVQDIPADKAVEAVRELNCKHEEYCKRNNAKYVLGIAREVIIDKVDPRGNCGIYFDDPSATERK